jgi:hypothetical protein
MRCSLAIPGELYFSGDELKPAHLSEAELATFAGRYHSDELDATYTLSAERGRLTFNQDDKPPVIFDPATANEFYSSDFRTLVFQPDADGHISRFKVFTQAARGIIFNRVR